MVWLILVCIVIFIIGVALKTVEAKQTGQRKEPLVSMFRLAMAASN
mgnify:CR=1 FL=1